MTHSWYCSIDLKQSGKAGSDMRHPLSCGLGLGAVQNAIQLLERPDARIRDVPVYEFAEPGVANPSLSGDCCEVAALRSQLILEAGVKSFWHASF